MTVVAGEAIAMPVDQRPRSLVDLVHRSVVRVPDKVALRWKHGGEWQSWTYADLWNAVTRTSLALRASGVGAGDRVVILSRSRPEWLVADLAILALGAVTCPIYPGDSSARMADIVRRVGARLAFVEDAKLLQRLTDGLGPDREAVRFVLFEDGTAHTTLDDLSRDVDPSPDALAEWDASWQKVNPAQVATIVHTIGASGDALGVVLAHGSLIHSSLSVVQFVPNAETDTVLSVLPMSHMFERSVGILVPLMVGATVAFADRQMDRWVSDMAAVRPTTMAVIPLFLERLEQRIRSDVAGRSRYLRAAFGWALRLGERSYENHLAGRRDGPWLQLQRSVARRTVLARARRAFGGRLRMFLCGGAALPEATGRFFDALGIPVIEGYGLTESAPILTGNRPASYRYGTVGPPAPDTEVRIDPVNGEILGRGQQVMLGYLDRPEDTARVLDAEGWLRTGDVGEWDEAGRLRITGRIKNLLVLSTGKKVAPAPIERAVRESPYVAQAVLLGDDSDVVGMLVVPDLEAVRSAVGGSDGVEGPAEDEVAALLRKEVERLTASFAPFERPRRIRLLPRPLSADSGEIDEDGRPNRAAVIAAFPSEVDALFDRNGNH